MAYAVDLKKYEYSGPLDLLLDMISHAKIDIKDIFISEITEQYLEAMKLSAYLEAHPDLTLAEINALLNKGFENYDLLVGLTSFQEFREFCYAQDGEYAHLQWELVYYLESEGKIKHRCEIYHTTVGTLMRAS